MISRVMEPRTGLDLWRMLKEANLNGGIQTLIIQAQLWNGFSEVDPNRPRPDSERNRGPAAEIDSTSFFATRERTLRSEWQKIESESRRVSFPFENLLEIHRKERDTLSVRDLRPEQLPPTGFPTFYFTTVRRQIQEALRQAQLASGSNAEEKVTTPALDDSVRVLVMSARPADVPIHLQFGGWNECPAPPEHAAVISYWRKKHDAQLVYVGVDNLEFWVGRPPTTLKEVKDLAWQQYLFCNDIVDQGAGTITELGRELAGSRSWFFWWD